VVPTDGAVPESEPVEEGGVHAGRAEEDELDLEGRVRRERRRVGEEEDDPLGTMPSTSEPEA